MDHKEFLLRLGAEFAPGDLEGPSTKIAEENYMAIHHFHEEQKVGKERRERGKS